MCSFNFAPKGWALCNGQALPINQNQALFSLMGTTYGGDGISTFHLPDLRSRIPMHMGNSHVIGEQSGEESHTLVIGEIPAHNHTASCSPAVGAQAGAAGNVWAEDNNGNAPYSNGFDTSLAPNALSTVGGGQAHNNMAPFLTLNFCIALQGIFPSQT
jgi:microcystin-dependent protein